MVYLHWPAHTMKHHREWRTEVLISGLPVCKRSRPPRSVHQVLPADPAGMSTFPEADSRPEYLRIARKRFTVKVYTEALLP